MDSTPSASRWPSRMMEPLPNCRSIWVSVLSIAFAFSVEMSLIEDCSLRSGFKTGPVMLRSILRGRRGEDVAEPVAGVFSLSNGTCTRVEKRGRPRRPEGRDRW
jgi:hypothetical protein